MEELPLPESLVLEIRQWPLPEAYARAFAGRRYGETALPSWNRFRDTNYETQQSPLYYFLAGRALALLPPFSAIAELYVLRLLNVVCGFLVGLLVASAARVVGFGEQTWMPVALLAFVPGFSLTLSRASNDALCALLVTAALAWTLPGLGGSPKAAALASLAGGLAPWAKLYGIVVLPSVMWRSFRARPASLRTALLALWAVPLLLLALFSWRIHGHLLPLQENLRVEQSASLLDVPWVRDAWTIAKTHIWASGMSFLVFPTWLYFLPVLLLFFGAALTLGGLRALTPEAQRRLLFLFVPFALFLAALAYHRWRNFSFYGGPGGTGGWYLWAVALPEALLLLWGVARRPGWRIWALAGLGLFLLISILGDVALVASSVGRVRTAGAGHVIGIDPAGSDAWLGAFLATRPPTAAVVAAAAAVSSWIMGILLIGKGRRTIAKSPT